MSFFRFYWADFRKFVCLYRSLLRVELNYWISKAISE